MYMIFRGTSGIDIDLQKVDIDQCALPPDSTALNVFQGSDKCKPDTTEVGDVSYLIRVLTWDYVDL